MTDKLPAGDGTATSETFFAKHLIHYMHPERHLLIQRLTKGLEELSGPKSGKQNKCI